MKHRSLFSSGTIYCLLFSIGLRAQAPVGTPSARDYEIYVSPSGNDQNPGAIDRPVASMAQAQKLARARKASGQPVTVFLREGVYYLPAPLVFTPMDSGTKESPVIYQAYKKETPVISGGQNLKGLFWRPYKNGIMQAAVAPDLKTDQLFVNGERQILARYPNYDPKQLIFHGYAADAISPQRAASWANPIGGFFHAMHPDRWGDFSYEITGKNSEGKLTLTGGWQNNRPRTSQTDFVGDVLGIHHDFRFVENIFEELDAPDEWFLDRISHTLYFYPPVGLDLNKAKVETVNLRDLVEFQGTQHDPVKFVSLKGITFRDTARTFMDTREKIVRADWALYRGGAVFLNGTEDCALENSFFDQLGGNVIFVNNYNRRVTIQGCHIYKAGSNGIVFLGDPAAVRNPIFDVDHGQQSFNQIDKAAGPLTDNYPADSLVDDCLIHETGCVEKQTAPIEIDLAQSITIRHCSIYDVPRAGINIGDGCWGGHVVEYCDIFDTVKETGDHGSYNSWARDRWWNLKDVDLNKSIAAENAGLPKLDAVKTIILRNNRWRCDHGWDIDLDDGSTNYQIVNNLCLNGGIKNREGFYRVVENNILVNNGFSVHVWFADSGDTFRHNLVWRDYLVAHMPAPPWGAEMDHNLVVKVGAQGTQPATSLQKQGSRDEHSIIADPMFIDPASGDYRVKNGSPALALGFVNFPMNQFGVQKPKLAVMARTPDLPGGGQVAKAAAGRDATIKEWSGAQVRDILDEGEMSVYGLPGVTGVLVLKVDPASAWAKAGLQANDVILSLNDATTDKVSDLPAVNSGSAITMKIRRSQQEKILNCLN